MPTDGPVASTRAKGQGVAVREYTALNDADAEWIPERAARLVADFLGSSAEPARPHATKKSAARLEREIDQAIAQPELSRLAAIESDARARMRPGALEDAMTKARAQVARSDHRQSIWMTRDGELRVRPMFETVSPLWFFVRHVPSDDELRVEQGSDS